MQDYLVVYREKRESLDFDLSDFINGLEVGQLNSLVEDILTENERAYEIFSPSKNVDSDELAFRFIRKMPYNTYSGVRDFLETLFLNSVKGMYRNSEKVINNILALTARRRDGLSNQFILLQLNNPDVAKSIKTRLAIILSKIEDSPSLDFFDQEINYRDRPYLLPAYISAFKNSAPLKAFAKLTEVNGRPSDFQLYKAPLATSLENILLKKGHFAEFKNIFNKLSPWAKKEIDEILNSGNFLKKNIKQSIENFHSNKKVVKVGISFFPDIMLLDFAEYKGKFLSAANDFYKIDIVHWNKIFQDLVDRKFDFILANRQTCDEKNRSFKAYEFITPLIEYKGFSLIFRNDLNISLTPYSVLRANHEEESELQILKRTLFQLKNHKLKIFASKDTDHYSSLLSLLNMAEMKSNDLTIIADREPNEGPEMFIRKEIDALIGGLPQKLIAIKNKGRELIRPEDFPLPFNQVNGLICLKPRAQELEEQAGKIVNEWFEIIKEIENKPGELQAFVDFYNERAAQFQQTTIDESLFHEYWTKTYTIPSSEEDAERLRKPEILKQQQELQRKLLETKID